VTQGERRGADLEAARIREYFARPHLGSGRWPLGRAYLVVEKRELLRRAARSIGSSIPELTICDVGCGTGDDLLFWKREGVPAVHLAGTEMLPDRAAYARRLLPGSRVEEVSDFQLPFPDGSVALTTASLVFSAILDTARRAQLFNEMRRVTAGGGAIAVYDFWVRRPGNSNVAAMTGSRIARLGPSPSARWPAGPFLPALDLILRLPGWLHGTIGLLPRTHALWVWRPE
jgi:SAM-dependent methyltransferase